MPSSEKGVGIPISESLSRFTFAEDVVQHIIRPSTVTAVVRRAVSVHQQLLREVHSQGPVSAIDALHSGDAREDVARAAAPLVPDGGDPAPGAVVEGRRNRSDGALRAKMTWTALVAGAILVRMTLCEVDRDDQGLSRPI